MQRNYIKWTRIFMSCVCCTLFLFSAVASARSSDGDLQLKRSYLILNLTDMNDLPNIIRIIKLV